MLTSRRNQKIKQVANNRQQGIIVLEDIHDPHNAAAVLRSCDGFGFQTVYFIFDQQDKFNPRKIGKATSSSANKWLEFKIYNSTKQCLAALHRRGYEVYATVLNANAQSIFATKFTKPKIALMFGNEHRGLSDHAIKGADHKLYIPMRGFVQSLNLSVTAAICMYEVARQRQGLSKYSLAAKNQKKLVQAWNKK